MEIGAICNNASLERRENGKFVGQSTDVALLEVLDVFGLEDARRVSFLLLSQQHLYVDN
jgi:P-type Ca2+ transporter type 2C